jgi:hypothetical protein
MSFSEEAIPVEPTKLSIEKHGLDTPFVHHSVIQKYVASLVQRNGYEKFISYGTTVELAEKVGKEWKLVLRRECEGGKEDEWWEEYFDAIVVANGHYNVPYIPTIPGLKEFEQQRPGSVKHTKMFRGRDAYKDKVRHSLSCHRRRSAGDSEVLQAYPSDTLSEEKTILCMRQEADYSQKVIVVGASVSAADIAYDLATVASHPVYAVVVGRNFNTFFGDEAFKHPGITQKQSIRNITTSNGERTVHFQDGSSVTNVDYLIFGTGYTWTLPFLPHVEVRNNRVPNLYQHVIYTPDPTLLFVGAVGAGLTFKIFEWQAVLAARILADRVTSPPVEEQKKWEEDRVKEKGDGPKFTMINPHFEAYFEKVRELAGEQGPGRRLPHFDQRWVERFDAGHEIRKKWWREENERARAKL